MLSLRSKMLVALFRRAYLVINIIGLKVFTCSILVLVIDQPSCRRQDLTHSIPPVPHDLMSRTSCQENLFDDEWRDVPRK